jgi:intracellular septation protein
MNFLKLFCEIFPLISFFVVYKFYNLFYATLSLIVTTIISLCLHYIKYKKVTKSQIFSLCVILLFGSLTLITKNADFIKMKLTIINLVFALVLLIGVYLKKPFLQYIIGPSIQLSEKDWLKLSSRWSIFFFIIAILNEIIWRNYSDKIWVNFKVFGVIPLSLVFIISQMPFIHKNSIDTSKK